MSWVWWHVPVIPATQEAEVGGSLESGILLPSFCTQFLTAVSQGHAAALQAG